MKIVPPMIEKCSKSRWTMYLFCKTRHEQNKKQNKKKNDLNLRPTAERSTIDLMTDRNTIGFD